MYPSMDLGLQDAWNNLKGWGLDDNEANQGTALVAPLAYQRREDALKKFSLGGFPQMQEPEKPSPMDQGIDLSFKYAGFPQMAPNAAAASAASGLTSLNPNPAPARHAGKPLTPFSEGAEALNPMPFEPPAPAPAPKPVAPAQEEDFFAKQRAEMDADPRFSQPAYDALSAEQKAWIDAGDPRNQKAPLPPGYSSRGAFGDPNRPSPFTTPEEARQIKARTLGVSVDQLPPSYEKKTYGQEYDANQGRNDQANMILRARQGDKAASDMLWVASGKNPAAYMRAVQTGQLPYQLQDQARNAEEARAQQAFNLSQEQIRHGMQMDDKRFTELGRQFDVSAAQKTAMLEAQNKHQERLAQIEELKVNGQINEAQERNLIAKANAELERNKFEFSKTQAPIAREAAQRHDALAATISLVTKLTAPDKDGNPGMDPMQALQLAQQIVKRSSATFPGMQGGDRGAPADAGEGAPFSLPPAAPKSIADQMKKGEPTEADKADEAAIEKEAARRVAERLDMPTWFYKTGKAGAKLIDSAKMYFGKSYGDELAQDFENEKARVRMQQAAELGRKKFGVSGPGPAF